MSFNLFLHKVEVDRLKADCIDVLKGLMGRINGDDILYGYLDKSSLSLSDDETELLFSFGNIHYLLLLNVSWHRIEYENFFRTFATIKVYERIQQKTPNKSEKVDYEEVKLLEIVVAHKMHKHSSYGGRSEKEFFLGEQQYTPSIDSLYCRFMELLKVHIDSLDIVVPKALKAEKVKE